MIDWIVANVANIIAVLIVAALVILAVRSMIKDRKAGKSSCGCGCANCAMAGKCHSQNKQ